MTRTRVVCQQTVQVLNLLFQHVHYRPTNLFKNWQIVNSKETLKCTVFL